MEDEGGGEGGGVKQFYFRVLMRGRAAAVSSERLVSPVVRGRGLPGLARRNLVGFGESWPESMSGTQSSGPRMRSVA